MLVSCPKGQAKTNVNVEVCHIMLYRVHIAMDRFKLTTYMVTGTDSQLPYDHDHDSPNCTFVYVKKRKQVCQKKYNKSNVAMVILLVVSLPLHIVEL